MSRHRFLAREIDPAAGFGLVADPDEIHHLTKVLRLREGDEIEIFDGKGQQYLACIWEFSEGVKVRIVDRLPHRESSLQITLLQSIGKGDKMDTVVREGTQLGVWHFLPCMTEYGVVRVEGKRAAAKVERWQRIALEAVKQCGRAWVPVVHPVQDFAAGLAFAQDQLGCDLLLCFHCPAPQGLREVLQGEEGRSILVMIGPEGGFSPGEISQVEAIGGRIVGLGPRVLRTETAAVAALSAVGYALGDLGAEGEC